MIVQALYNAMIDSDVYRATKFTSEKVVLKLTRQHKLDRRSHQETFILTVGRPNYAERTFIRKCKLAGEPFPICKIQLKFYPRKKAKRAA